MAVLLPCTDWTGAPDAGGNRTGVASANKGYRDTLYAPPPMSPQSLQGCGVHRSHFPKCPRGGICRRRLLIASARQLAVARRPTGVISAGAPLAAALLAFAAHRAEPRALVAVSIAIKRPLEQVRPVAAPLARAHLLPPGRRRSRRGSGRRRCPRRSRWKRHRQMDGHARGRRWLAASGLPLCQQQDGRPPASRLQMQWLAHGGFEVTARKRAVVLRVVDAALLVPRLFAQDSAQHVDGGGARVVRALAGGALAAIAPAIHIGCSAIGRGATFEHGHHVVARSQTAARAMHEAAADVVSTASRLPLVLDRRCVRGGQCDTPYVAPSYVDVVGRT
mmetsp:Transcript_30194/g.100889  ORF Transcript_30194/g.100889 Transcript_30194/m.100889 type:complete len:334 (+) Transcript_30194:72-1073(+)